MGGEEGEWSEGEVGTEMLEAPRAPRTHHTPRTRTEVALVCSWREELSPRAFWLWWGVEGVEAVVCSWKEEE